MQQANQTLNGIPSSGVNRIGIARVCLPKNANRDEYISKSLSASSVALKDPFSGQIIETEAYVPTNLISFIKFPSEGNDDGCLVSYKVVDKRLLYVVDGVLAESDSGSSISKEGEHLLQGNNTYLYIGTDSSTLSANGEKAKLILQAIGSDAEVHILSGNSIRISARVEDDSTIANISFNPLDGWHILRNRDGSGAEPAVLGNTLKEELEKILDEIDNIAIESSKLIIASPFGPLGPPTNFQSFIDSSVKIKSIKSTIKKILSENLKID